MTFLEKYDLVKKSVPVPAVYIDQFTVDCEYVDYAYTSKNCYYCFDCFDLIDAMYTQLGTGSKLVDCTSVYLSEKCYECVDSRKCFSSTYLIDSYSSTDCHYSAFLNSCTDCFGCVALTHKKYCILNIQYSKSEYFKKVDELKRQSPEAILSQLYDLKKKIPHPASQQVNSENCPYGDYIYDAKNSYWCFLTQYSENSGYMYTSGTVKNCWDFFFSGGLPVAKNYCELSYEFTYSLNCYKCAFLINSDDCQECYFGDNLRNCSDCFGCVGLTNKKYCILNNQLTKDQYEKAVKEIKKELGWQH